MKVLGVLGLSAALLSGAPAPAQDAAKAQAAPAATSLAMVIPALNVSDVAASSRFYVDALGMKLLAQRHNETFLSLGPDAKQPVVMLMRDPELKQNPVITQGTGFNRLVLRVAGLTEIVARLKAGGYKVSDIRDVSMGYRMAMATDPDGYRLELVEAGARPEKK
ncbi:VOC family protein [Novosphingobium sp. TH158]|uniref:VOC family protein n=1 Tax=Novosphingobium sp. TH158 TaxID=2067455 RepID=UPI000C7C5C3B|nr:VOC family protein [Novosphingobium sp. TH158]PLK26205.1 hypothetical protein C0V78_04390 [Novosphingobium sp. TH158]